MYKLYMNVLILIVISGITAFSQPKLEIIGGDTYNWGEVSGSNSVLKAKVQIKNAGTELLKITNVRPTCGCTTAPLDKSELRPNEIATLDISLRIAGRNNMVSKSIRINSNDPNNPQKVLWLKCNIIRDIHITPSTYFSFLEMVVGYEKSSKLSIKNNSDKVLKLYDFETQPSNLNINLSGTVSIKPGNKIDLIAKAIPDKAGTFKGYVKFKTNNEEFKEVTINAYGRAKASPIFNDSK
jgi:hypothetical protein